MTTEKQTTCQTISDHGDITRKCTPTGEKGKKEKKKKRKKEKKDGKEKKK
jgi:hypothetical protein